MDEGLSDDGATKKAGVPRMGLMKKAMRKRPRGTPEKREPMMLEELDEVFGEGDDEEAKTTAVKPQKSVKKFGGDDEVAVGFVEGVAAVVGGGVGGSGGERGGGLARVPSAGEGTGARAVENGGLRVPLRRR